ncbi:FKBP-type peptidyl-prolyl cis-trans isomerase [Pokkaliibacter sp. CJK22405]|uniref:FKBP-type peptidyl-prolyl cis-trans isomerase n=1 Tax=Pokkaliibacter sp. CJK22405 TaxID=3384615 RepID=UPI0039856730
MTLQVSIEDITPGTGKTAKRGSLITAHYRGFLDDGHEFDSSFSRNTPFQCVLSNKRVIQGWVDGVQGMQEGGKRRLHVPAALAYGERGMGDKVPANANLTFEIELLEVLNRDD